VRPWKPPGRSLKAETTRQIAEGKINELLDEAFSGARVFQGGGNEILGNNLQEMALEAADNSLKRLYPQFLTADHIGWSKVYEKARKGAPDALKGVGDDGEPGKNAVCKAILGFIAGGKKGADVRRHFESSPFGWSRDAVDGGIQVLLVAGLVRAQDDHGKTLDIKSLERKTIGKVMFKVESATVTTAQRIQVRKLLQKVGISAKHSEELVYVPQFLQKLMDLADRAGGEAPKPERPDTTGLEEIRLTSGNEQLLALYNRREELAQTIDSWSDLAGRIDKRRPTWITLKRVMGYANGIQDAEVILAQVKNIEKQRRVTNLTQLLREELNRLDKEYQARHDGGMKRLKADTNWQQLDPEERDSLLAEQKLTLANAPKINVAGAEEIVATLERITLSALTDRVAAMPSRFDAVLVGAAELMEPEAQFVKLPNRTIKTEQDINVWLDDAKAEIQKALKNGPVIIH